MGFSHKREFTETEIILILDTQRSVTELCDLVKASSPTISKARKELGITTIRGARKGRVGARHPKIVCICQNPNCKKEMITIETKFRKFCCTSCQMIVSNNGPKGKGNRPIRNPNTPAYKRYARIVHGLSHEVYINNIDIINPERYPRTLCGVAGGWQLDHIIPIKECFEKGMSVEEAANINNLRMLPWKENLMRQYKNV